MQTTLFGRSRALTFYQKTALCCVPGFVLFALFWVCPFGVMVYYSFMESAFRHTFVGIKNYAFVWNNAYYRMAIGNSILFSLTAVPFCWVLAFIIALFLEKLKDKGDVFLGFFLLPLAVPSSATIEI